MIPFSIVVAVDQNNGIGKNGDLPWYLPEDLKHFKEVTCKVHANNQANMVIMGRKTWDSLPNRFKPLPNRINCVISRNENLELPEDVLYANSLDAALDLASNMQNQNQCGSVFVIGGGQIFKESLGHSQCEKLYLTHIESDFDCDVFLSDFSNQFSVQDVSENYQSNENISYHFAIYRR